MPTKQENPFHAIITMSPEHSPATQSTTEEQYLSKRKNYINSCEISELTAVQLCGAEQKIAIEGKSKSLPVVLMLHGGPGSPVPFSVGCRGLFPEWTDKAILVYWDQLGCGINNCRLNDDIHIENFVQMTCDLVEYIKQRFPENKLYLFGVSWGSILALNVAVRVPEKLNGVFVYGQVLKNLFFNEEVARSFDNAPPKVRHVVKKILDTRTDCPYELLDKNLKMLYQFLSKYTNAYFNKNAKRAPIGKIIFGLLTSPDYSLKDFKAVMKNGYAGNTSLWEELLNIDLTPRLADLKVKYLLLQGETDIITSTSNVLNAVENSKNQNVTVKVIKNSGHMPSAAAMDECLETLLQFIGE